MTWCVEVFVPEEGRSEGLVVGEHVKATAFCLSLRFMKDALPVIIPYITCIINTSVVTGTFPAAWKHAIVTPLFKKGDPTEFGNYRLISFLPIFSKVIEKIVANQLVQYTEHNSLLSSTQHGFRPKLSTETALLQVSKKIYDAIDNR